MSLKGELLMQFAIAGATAFLRQDRFAHWLGGPDVDLAGEILIRLLVSAVLTPGGVLTSDDDDELRRVARHVLSPLLQQEAGARARKSAPVKRAKAR